MRENNGPAFDYPPSERCTTRFVVCSIPRTGSTLLCRGLWQTEAAGAPKEYFNPVHRRDYEARWRPTGTLDYLRRLLRHRTSPNGVFGFKAHWTHMRELAETIDLDRELPGLHYIQISRRDKLRQAISWVRAKQTGQWSSDTDARGEPHYDADAIRQHLTYVARMEDSWERHFREQGIAPLRVLYEDLTGDYQATLARVFDFLGVAAPARLPEPPIERQSDALTEAMVERFRRGRASTARAGSPAAR